MPENPAISQIKISEGSTDVTYDVKDTKARSSAIQFATCSTAAATGTKVVECSDFTLANEAKILVKFDNTNSAAVSNLKLNVNSTGAKVVRYRGANLPLPGLIKAGGLYLFVYTDNQYWNIIGDLDTFGDGMFATCSTAADVATKEVTIDNFDNKEGAVIFVKFTNTNTATGTLYLKVNGSSSRMKYRSSDLATSGIIIANSIHAFVKTSSYWYLVGEIYQHPTYTARTGKPTENLTPSFGDTITISQITSDATGHVTAATDRTIKIPNDVYSYNSSGYGTRGLVPAPSSSDSSKYLQAGSGWVALPTAGLSTAGIVKLSSSTSDTSTSTAATSSAVKSAYDLANGKSAVSFTQTLTSGTKIGSISINGSSTDIYCSTDTDTQVHVKKATTTKAYLMGTSTTPTTSNQQTTALADTGVYLTTTAGELQATNFVGKINGFDIGMSVPSGSALTDTWTPMTGATSSANGTVGYVNATPPKDGYNTKYLRADGTWAVPPGTVDSKVSQTATTDDAFYRILLSNSDSDATETSGAKKASDLAYNASSGLLTVGDGIYYNELQPDGTTYLKRPLIRHGSDNFYIGGTGRLPGSSSDHRDHLGQTYIFTGYDAKSGTYNKNLYMCFYNDDGAAFTIVPLWHTLMTRADFTSNVDDWSTAGLRLDDFASDSQFKIIRHMKASGASSYTDVPAWFAAKGGVGLGVKRDGQAGIISFDTNQTWSGTNTTVPTVSFAGGIVSDTNNNYKKPSWYFKLTGTNGATYNLDNFSTTDVKVAQNNTTANAAYRVLLSYSSNDTNETNTARKSSGLTYNPSTGVLGVNGYTVSGTSNSSYNFDDFSTIKRFSTSSNGQDNGWSTIVTSNGLTKLQDSNTSSVYVTRHTPVSGTTVYEPPAWYAAKHSVGLMFANQNQVAIMSMASNNSTPLIKFGATGGGPNGTPVADSIGPANPGNGVGWYFGLTGTTATTYNLDSFSTTDTKVTQTISTGNANYRILMSYTDSNTTATEGARKASGFYYNPSTTTLTVGKVSGQLIATLLDDTAKYTVKGLPLMSAEPDANEKSFDIKMSNGFRYSQAPGTTSSEGTAILVLGNGVATGTAGNKTGGVRFYGSGANYINLKAGPMLEDFTTWIPKVRTEHSTLTATKVVYELASGVATSVTLNDSIKITTSKAPTYFKVYMRKFRTTSGNTYTLAYYDSVEVQAVANRATTFVLCDSYTDTSPVHTTFTGHIKVTNSNGYFKLELFHSGKKYTLSGTSITQADLLASEQAFGIYKIVAVYETHD